MSRWTRTEHEGQTMWQNQSGERVLDPFATEGQSYPPYTRGFIIGAIVNALVWIAIGIVVGVLLCP